MKQENGKIDVAIILILLAILIVLLYILAPQNIKINEPGFIVQYWQNISRAVTNIGRSFSNALNSLGQGINNFFGNINLK